MKYWDYTNPSSRAHITWTDTFTALLANCAWYVYFVEDLMLSFLIRLHRYLYEIGDYDTCLKLVDTASIACDDKDSSRYANLRNTSGACYFDLNRLRDCRRDWVIALSIQEKLFDNDVVKVGYMVHNMGNLETGCGRYDEAMELFTRAVNIHLAFGDSAATQLALTYLCIGRLYYFQGLYDEAVKTLASSEALFVRTSGAETHFMA
jgi:tetratricopeptide (TPR) repeat protein